MSRTIVGLNGPEAQPDKTILTGPPRHITPRHWAELQASAIPEDLAALNIRSFGPGFSDASGEREALLYEAKAQAGDQPGHAYQRLLRLDALYSHVLAGGWRSTCDALPGFEPFNCWKPDQPRLSAQQKLIKYEHAPKVALAPLFPQVPQRIWLLVAERYGLTMPPDCSGGFWQWVKAVPEVPLVLTEGLKKALALLALGIPAIALPGVEAGRRVPEVEGQKRRDLAYLVPELKALAVEGRRFVIAFDRDTAKPETARKVEGAAVRLGHVLAAAHCEVGIARIPELLGADKTGADDLIAAGLTDELLEALAMPLSLAEVAWEVQLAHQRRIRPTKQLHARRLFNSAQLAKVPDAPIVAIRSPKASGKTELQCRWLATEPEVVAITHRRSLGADLANRLGLQWRNDLDAADGRSFNEATGERWQGLPPRLALCLDSLLVLGNPARYENTVLVLDEAVQGLSHGVTSSTKNCAEHRGELLQQLQGLIRHCKRIVLLDADLDDATLLWVKQARGEGAEIELIENEAKPAPWPVTWWDHSTQEAIQQTLIAEVKAGGRPMVVTDSRRAAEALNHLLEHTTGWKGLLVNRDTVDSPEVQAMLPRLNDADAVAELFWLVASPSISSGVSIEHNAFDAVYGLFFGGSLDDAECLQALARVRPAVPRHVWVSKSTTAHHRVSSAWWAKEVEADARRRWNDEATLLRRKLAPDLLAGTPLEVAESFEATLKLWATITARRNYSHAHLRGFVLARLRHEGHAITINAEPLEQSEAQALRRLKIELKTTRDDAAAEAIASAPAITTSKAAELQRRQWRTPAQQAAIQRRAICERMALPPEQLTAQQVQWANQWGNAAHRLLQMLEPQLAAAADLEQLQATTAGGWLVPWDQGLRLERSTWAEAIGLRAFVEQWCKPGALWWDTNTKDVQAIAKLARQNRKPIGNAFGIQIGAWPTDAKGKALKHDPDAVKLLNSLLKRLGITVENKRVGSGARQYRPEPAQLQALLSSVNRLRQKASAKAPLPPVSLKQQQDVEPLLPLHQAPARPWLAPALWEQLPLATATDGHLPAQCPNVVFTWPAPTRRLLFDFAGMPRSKTKAR